ncbi:YoaK family protein [Bradyrhizobium sp. USDA 10063]
MLDSRRNMTLACALSALAGYLDGIGYLHLGGLFVSFMSGNSTRLGVNLTEANWFAAAQTIGIIVTFVFGAAAGSLIALGRGGRRQTWLLLTESLLLIGAGLAYAFGWPVVAVAAIVFAMGLENAVFEVGGGSALGLTYVTGALVKAGQLLGAALSGGARWDWLPNLLLWAALVSGSTVGALAYLHFNLSAVWFAAGAAVVLTAIVAVRDK